MTRIIIISFIFLNSFTGFSQTNKFQITYGGSGGEEAFNMANTSDGGFVFVGRTTSFGITKEDVYVTKVDIESNVKWSKAIGGSTNSNVEYGFSIHETSDKGYIICGSYQPNGSGNANFYLLKLDSIGNKVWSKTISGSQSQIGKSVVEMADGNFLAVGQTASYGAGIDDIYLIKISKTGSLLSATTIGGTMYDDALKIIKTNDGGYAITGKTESFGAGQADVFLIKLDSTATVSWSKTYGGTTHDYGYNLMETGDGGFAITGYTMSYTAGLRDILLMKINSSGDFEWAKSYGGTADDEGLSVGQLSNGDYVITGLTKSFGAGGRDIALLKTDSSGALLTFRVLGGAVHETGVSLSIREDNLWVFGQTSSFGSGSIDWLFAKVDISDLSTGCNESLVTTAVVNDAPLVASTPTIIISTGNSISTVSPTVTSVSTLLKTLCFSCNEVIPIADFSFTINDKTVSFTDNSQNSPAVFSWNFGDSNTSTNQNPEHIFSTYGTYTICLTVTNCAGTHTVCKDITLTSNQPPDADFSFVVSGYDVVFTDLSSGSPSTWSWYFGDSTASSTLQNPTHTYLKGGSYEVCLGVGNTFGNSIDCKTVIVFDPPTALFGYIISESSVSFTDSSSENPTAWFWDFGDGNTSILQNPSHIYSDTGNFQVCLLVSNQGGSDSICSNIKILSTGVNELHFPKNNISIFPNPITEQTLNFYGYELLKNNCLIIYDNFGRTIFTAKNLIPSEKQVATLPNLKKGLYYATFFNGTWKKSVRVVVP